MRPLDHAPLVGLRGLSEHRRRPPAAAVQRALHQVLPTQHGRLFHQASVPPQAVLEARGELGHRRRRCQGAGRGRAVGPPRFLPAWFRGGGGGRWGILGEFYRSHCTGEGKKGGGGGGRSEGSVGAIRLGNGRIESNRG